MKTIMLTTLFSLSVALVTAQTQEVQLFKFENDRDAIENAELQDTYIGEHALGEEIAVKIQLLRESYTWLDEPSAIRPTPVRTIEKPSIYLNIKKLERYYKKGVKKGWFDLETAQKELSQIVDVALIIRYQPTEDLEDTLRKIKDEEQMAQVFTKNIELE